MTKHEIVIVGGGLSGLVTAYRLQEAGREFLLLEASNTLGGRIQSIRHPKTNAVLGDLGPSWIWPSYQPNTLEWVQRLGLGLHEQYAEGLGVFEENRHELPRHLPMPRQSGIARITGGPQALVDQLVAKLQTKNLRHNHPVSSISVENGVYTVMSDLGERETVQAKRIIFACPLRIAATIRGVTELLPGPITDIARNTPTWMAGHAKVTAVYEEPFWRKQGQSGRVFSHVGPLVEIHDISSETGLPAALFGFSGISPDRRKEIDQEPLVLEQLRRCFGEEALEPVYMEVKDWAREPFICTQEDRDFPPSHPQQVPDFLREPQQNESLFFSVSETGSTHPGLISGAIESGERVARQIIGL